MLLYDMRNQLINDIKIVKDMDIREYIIYQKWLDLNNTDNDNQYNLFDNNDVSYLIDRIWTPTQLNDYKDLSPYIIDVDDNNIDEWFLLRKFFCGLKYSSTPGRSLKYIIADRHTNKYIGILHIVSDFWAVKCRDTYIGWSKQHKKTGKLNHTALGAVIVPFQPFGYYYCGGKLLALLAGCDKIRYDWQTKYNDKLVGLTTTSLFGSYSQYTGLKYWHKCGKTTGETIFEPSPKIYKKLKELYKQENIEYYNKIITGSSVKLRLLKQIFKKLDLLDLAFTNYKRGVFFNEFYTNTKEFLIGEINDDNLIIKYDPSIDSLVDLWKTKYVDKRVKSITFGDGEILCYSNMCELSWTDTKKLYL